MRLVTINGLCVPASAQTFGAPVASIVSEVGWLRAEGAPTRNVLAVRWNEMRYDRLHAR
jgi:hypothetical protein